MDEFEFEAVSVLKLTKIRIGHDGKGIGAGWFLDKVVVKQIGEPKYDTEFVCNRYVNLYIVVSEIFACSCKTSSPHGVDSYGQQLRSCSGSKL